MHDPYESRFLEKLHADIVSALNDAHTKLGNGTQIVPNDATATGMNCARYVGEIKGLNDVLQLMRQIQSEMNSKIKRGD